MEERALSLNYEDSTKLMVEHEKYIGYVKPRGRAYQIDAKQNQDCFDNVLQ